MYKVLQFVCAVILYFNASISFASLILHDLHGQYDFWGQISSHSPIGQSFTAEDARISTIGFYIVDANGDLVPDDHDLTVELYSGFGNSGDLISSTTIEGIELQSTLPYDPGYSDWLYFDFSSVTLDVGSLYTAVLVDDSGRWGVYASQNTIPGSPFSGSVDYEGGDAIFNGEARIYDDLTFSVTPVPVPAAFWLFISGALGLVSLAKHNKFKKREKFA